MALNRVNPSGWGSTDKLTPAQINALDANVTGALDKSPAGDTLQGRIVVAGAGRIASAPLMMTDANTTLLISTANEVMLGSALTASRQLQLSSSGVSVGDRVLVWAAPSMAATIVVNVVDQAGTQLIAIGLGGTAEATWAEFEYQGGWLLQRSGRGAGFSQTFTASGAWVCPAGVTSVRLYGVGGGGGGGGGYSSGAGGAGGGGAVPGYVSVPVTPGASYPIVIGLGGMAGATGASPGAGGAGGDTTFGTLAIFRGAGGGQGAPTSGAITAIGGSNNNLFAASGAAVAFGQGGSIASADSAPRAAMPCERTQSAPGLLTVGPSGVAAWCGAPGGASYGPGGQGAMSPVSGAGAAATTAHLSSYGGGGGGGSGGSGGTATYPAAPGAGGMLRIEWSR